VSRVHKAVEFLKHKASRYTVYHKRKNGNIKIEKAHVKQKRKRFEIAVKIRKINRYCRTSQTF